MRQIPYTMMKFAAFERTVEFLYKYVVPVPRDSLSKPKQLVVTFAAGYIAGVFCAIVSHPADSVVSKLNSDKGSTAWQAAKDLGMVGKSRLLSTSRVLSWCDAEFEISLCHIRRQCCYILFYIVLLAFIILYNELKLEFMIHLTFIPLSLSLSLSPLFLQACGRVLVLGSS